MTNECYALTITLNSAFDFSRGRVIGLTNTMVTLVSGLTRVSG